MIDPVALRAELEADPEGLGYAAPLSVGDHATVADLLNEVDPARPVDRGEIPTTEIRNAVVPSEWSSLTAAQRDALIFLTAGDTIDVRSANVRAGFVSAFGPQTTTRTNLAALQTRPGSRAEELWGLDARVSAADVGAAMQTEG